MKWRDFIIRNVYHFFKLYIKLCILILINVDVFLLIYLSKTPQKMYNQLNKYTQSNFNIYKC